MKEIQYKIMFGMIKKMFIALLTSIVNDFNHTKFVSLSNEKWEIQPAVINLHPSEYSQELHHYPFTVKLDRCVGSCNTLNDLSNKACVLNKTEDLNIHVFNIITRKNESKILAEDTSCKCKCKCKFDAKNLIQIKSRTMINVSASVKNIIYVKKLYLESCYK